MNFLFTPPAYDSTHSKVCNEILQIGAIANRLANENRQHITHADGRAENVAEHSYMLGRICIHLANTLYPELSLSNVALYSMIHDDLEAYVGDTPTHELTHEIAQSKAERERLALEQLEKDFANQPSYVSSIKVYEEQKVAEARFVRVVDKLMPLLTNIVSGGNALVSHWSKDELLHNVSTKNTALLAEYPEFSQVIDLRQELKIVASERLF